jgi:hypothetical protein
VRAQGLYIRHPPISDQSVLWFWSFSPDLCYPAGIVNVLLLQVDGKLPNLALMRLSTWHKQQGDQVTLVQNLAGLPDATDRVYASSIFTRSSTRREQIAALYPDALTGGTGYRFKSQLAEVITDCDPDLLPLDYSHYPTFTASIGYSQRGCRLDCSFCRMKTREGDARSVHTLHEIWRGDTFPRHIHLLDNDFFGQSEWKERLTEAREGKFKLSFTQGINIRLVNEEQARMLADTGYWDDAFKIRRLYTAWDNIGDERLFKSGVEMLQKAGIPPRRLLVYMLVGFKGSKDDPNKLNQPETEKEVLYRINELKALGCRPYPMVYDRSVKWLCEMQRWVIRRYYLYCDWKDFDPKLSHGRR